MNLTAILLTGVLSFIIVVALAKPVIKKLRKLKFGQEILEIGPSWHASKRGTPIMGGLLFIFSTAVSVLVYYFANKGNMDTSFILVFLCGLGNAFIGFIDDYTKVVKKRNLGLSALQKLILQAVVAVCFLVGMGFRTDFVGDIYLPFSSVVIAVPFWGYLIFSAILIIGFVNAVNLTDGLDGLATGVMIPVAIFFCAAFYYLGASPLAAMSSALAGGLIGFLLFNFSPAKVFMGDTGSLFLGGMLCALCYALRMPLIIIVVGLLFLIEAVSVILQVGYFKLTKGKRLFKMAPLHHHFEKNGHSEKTIVLCATVLSVVLCTGAYYALYMMF